MFESRSIEVSLKLLFKPMTKAVGWSRKYFNQMEQYFQSLSGQQSIGQQCGVREHQQLNEVGRKECVFL